MASESIEKLKVVIVGDAGVGKTNLLMRFVTDSFLDKQVSTIGEDCKSKDLTLKGKTYRLEIWDTAGSERFRTITVSYWRGAKAAVYAFALSDRESLHNIPTWQAECKRKDSMASDAVEILCGTKCDLPRQVTTEEGKAKAKEYGLVYIETSALKRINIDELFNELVSLYQLKSEQIAAPAETSPSAITIKQFNHHKKQKNCII